MEEGLRMRVVRALFRPIRTGLMPCRACLARSGSSTRHTPHHDPYEILDRKANAPHQRLREARSAFRSPAACAC